MSSIGRFQEDFSVVQVGGGEGLQHWIWRDVKAGSGLLALGFSFSGYGPDWF